VPGYHRPIVTFQYTLMTFRIGSKYQEIIIFYVNIYELYRARYSKLCIKFVNRIHMYRDLFLFFELYLSQSPTIHELPRLHFKALNKHVCRAICIFKGGLSSSIMDHHSAYRDFISIFLTIFVSLSHHT